MNIEKYLILNKYLLSLFGVSEIKELLNELKNKSEGVDSDGRSYFVHTLRGMKNVEIPEDTLFRYDENIQTYIRKISYKREPINLKYFQYLAVLFTEIVLDNLKNKKDEFLYNLNDFLEKYKQEQDIKIIDQFTENDLRKLAFWMATGSGKTLIMHINYHQFFNYKLFSPDNILLITPNEGLSKQHFEELSKSGIPCRLYNGNLNGGFRSDNEVLIIEITKLVEEKKGGGKTLPIDAFEGKNLLFVDEGHKGRRSEEQKWAKLRNKLSKNGVVFEYSATFGQILSEKNPEILKEYAKSIVFDYSYKYFHLDGYGKNFFVLNVKQGNISQKEFQEGMFIANLLSFYEQLLVYEENKELAKEYNIEKPLWVFVGTTVTGEGEKSDVIQIVEFIKKVIEDEQWLRDWVEKLLNGKTNLKNEDGEDLFKEKYKYLRRKAFNLDDLYKKVFGGSGKLNFYEIKNAEGEIGLKIGENDYFGVINIGNISKFKKELESKGISVGQDAISGSLFDKIKREDSKINLLIGSKKFIEGWDTWRVSSMGLLNIGQGQGPQIIQLFGRGVRLKGKRMSLKRSGDSLEVQILETLNIYGFKADYLNKFLEAIRREEVEFETIEIPIQLQHKDKWESLYILSKPDKKFEEEEVLKLEIDEKIHYTVNLLPRISLYASKEREEGITTKNIKGEYKESRFPEDKIDLLDWQKIWQEIIEFKIQRNYWNLVFDVETLQNILLYGNYKLFWYPTEDLEQLENIALLIIKGYIDRFYRKVAKRFETENLRYDKLSQLPSPFVSEKEFKYVVQIDKKKEDLIEKIKKLTEEIDELIKKDTEISIYWDKSLYVPLLIKNDKIDKITPAGLVESEKEFVKGLKEYLEKEKGNLNFEVYLLRNHPFSGVGFQLQWSGFYPDFIMWIKKEEKQTLAFIDPKGLEHTKGLNDEKITFAKEIKEIEQKLGENNVRLESFIISKTPYNDLIKGLTNPPQKDEYIKNHVLFLDDKDWAEELFKLLGFLNT